MSQKKILVLSGPSGKDLKSVHYALALAERLQAQVYILQRVDASDSENSLSVWLGEALLELTNSARQAGLSVSHHLADQDWEEEILGLIKGEGIDLFVLSAADGIGGSLLRRIKSLIPSQIIQVKEKDHIHYL